MVVDLFHRSAAVLVVVNETGNNRCLFGRRCDQAKIDFARYAKVVSLCIHYTQLINVSNCSFHQSLDN